MQSGRSQPEGNQLPSRWRILMVDRRVLRERKAAQILDNTTRITHRTDPSRALHMSSALRQKRPWSAWATLGLGVGVSKGWNHGTRSPSARTRTRGVTAMAPRGKPSDLSMLTHLYALGPFKLVAASAPSRHPYRGCQEKGPGVGLAGTPTPGPNCRILPGTGLSVGAGIA
jgi:hypothetical protein